MKIVKKAGSMICESLCAHPKGSVGSPNKVAKRHSCLRSECFAYYKTVGVVFCSVACFNINCRWSVVREKKKDFILRIFKLLFLLAVLRHQKKKENIKLESIFQ